MVKYFIKFDAVPVNESGFIETFNERQLNLDTSYSDKVDFSVTNTILYDKKRNRYLVDRLVFYKVLENTKKYNKKLKEEFNE